MSDSPVVETEEGRCPGEPYDENVVTAALTQLALLGGHAQRAAGRLGEQGIVVSRQTLERWRDGPHAAEYARIREGVASQVQAVIAAEHESLAISGAELTAELFQRTKERIGEIPDRDLPGALRNAATATGIAVDKSLAGRERPVAMKTDQRSAAEILKHLEAMGVIKQIDPAPVIDATVVEETRA